MCLFVRTDTLLEYLVLGPFSLASIPEITRIAVVVENIK